ncbi:hypothetical protein SAMN05216345_103197 [Cupriavidus sp. YR651]|uniref:hypothetical protein n=1 Tax=Cupriavidus sp. YR651 TaxID=1855315 RepID=UPI00088A0708|nr:hypothetical protein [Cupriavidus sp. YR651]SDC66446.1 hypothetical protein SAMN05216345_103197 [Cupriavidus sp. YR651]
MTLTHTQIRLASLLDAGYQLTITRSAVDAKPVQVDVVRPGSQEIAGHVPWRHIHELLRIRRVVFDTGDVATATAIVAPVRTDPKDSSVQ